MPLSLIESWIESANDPAGAFPINNLPYGVYSTGAAAPRCCVAIGDQVLDLAVLERTGLLNTGGTTPVFDAPNLNPFMALGQTAWAEVRARLTNLLQRNGNDALSANDALRQEALNHAADISMHLPFAVTEYTDFYAGMQHAKNMGAILRGSDDLPANWLHIPIGYNGRASTVVVSGTNFHRPLGQSKAPDAAVPGFGPSKRLDIELEMGAVVGTSNPMGRPISVDDAEDMIFGYVLLNDWSARDIQGWEYQPLGPFQGKVFATTISPWVVTRAALEPFRVATPKREKELLPYLDERRPGLYDINLSVGMRPKGSDTETILSHTNYSRMYYSAAQQLCHHAIGGCTMRTGDLLGSGTISGPTREEYGSLMELSWGGKEPFTLSSGETRTFIEDGDTLTLYGHAEGDGYRVGFGSCSGTVLPSVKHPKN